MSRLLVGTTALTDNKRLCGIDRLGSGVEFPGVGGRDVYHQTLHSTGEACGLKDANAFTHKRARGQAENYHSASAAF